MSEPSAEHYEPTGHEAPGERELRRRLSLELIERADQWRGAANALDICLEGRVVGAETGQVTRGLVRLIQLSPPITTCAFIELQDDGPVGLWIFGTSEGGHVTPGETSTLALAKAVAIANPEEARRVPHERFFTLRRAHESSGQSH